jgi:hypothetical protein
MSLSFLLSDDPWSVLVFAMAGILTGLMGVMAFPRRTTWPAWRVPVALGVILAILATGSFVGVLTAGVGQALLALSGVWLVLGFVRSPWMELLTRGVALLRHARVQASILCLGSGLLLAWQVYYLDRKLANEIEAADSLLSSTPKPPDLMPSDARSALTDAGNTVALFQVKPGCVSPNETTSPDEAISRRGMTRKVIQTGPIHDDCNCHGWVFTGGHCWVLGNSVEQILKENRYQIVSSPNAGDLAVFRDDRGEVMHSGLVHSISTDGVVLLESKWGSLGRYIHTASDHIYAAYHCTYYHSPRNGHLLHGFDHRNTAPKTTEIPVQHGVAGDAEPVPMPMD